MSKSRFPRAAYVRRLESVYDELSAWRSIYNATAATARTEQNEARYGERANALHEIQRQLMNVIRFLDDLPGVS